ncbi:hypothetical protein FHG87_001496 [Trinorchestia longiramus]|nr:hypothetical protein FHG87_001496 [Trinorchestia longiramus]
MNPESVKNECLNSRTDSFKTLHESFSFEAEVPSEAGQTSWEAVFGDHNQLTDIVAPSFASTNKDQSVVSKSTLKSSPQTVGRVSVLLDRVKAEEGNNCTQVQDSSKVPISSTNLKICEVVKRRPRGRGRRRGKASRFSPMKAGKRELSDDKDELVDPAPIPVSLPDIKPVVTSPILQPVKRHRYALKFRERPEPFVMDPGYLRDLKYLELLRPKNIKEEHNLLTKLNMIYDRLGTDNFPQLLHGLRRKLIVRKEQRENGIPVFDFDAIEKFVSAHGRVPTNEERLRLEFIKARESGDSS